MYKNTNILSYFKPFAQPSQLNKRPLPEDKSEETRAIKRSRSTTPEVCQSKGEYDGEKKHLEQGLHRTSSRVNLGSASRQPPGQWDEELIQNAEPAHASRDETLHIPITPISHGPVSRKSDVLGSQCTSSMSSQRVVKSGEVVIRNSDDEFDSDSSLEDLDNLLQLEDREGQKEPSYPEPRLPSSSPNRNADDGHRKSRMCRTKTDIIFAPQPSALLVHAKRYKFDLEWLGKHKKQEDASIEEFNRANSMLRSLGQQNVSAIGICGTASKRKRLDATFIDIVMKEHGDDDELSKLKAAIQRTEALNHDKLWSFFDEQARKSPLEQSEFPMRKDDRLGCMLGKTPLRQQAFLSGYVSEFAMKERLPKDILVWIMEATCLESRDDLRYSYTATLTDASKDLTSILSPERIDVLFQKLGARVAALDVEEPVNPYAALSQSVEAVSRPNLLSILDLFRNLASSLGAETRMHVICILCRLVLDHSVANSCHVLSAIEDAFASLIESIPHQDLDPELHMVMSTAFMSITDANLRLRLLQNIPASCDRLILLRRRLALACFFQDIGYLSQHAVNNIDLKSIARHLEGPRFVISNATDYSEITTAIGTLSIAIDCGDPPSSPYATKEELAFNRDIDALALRVNSMFADIVDTGASRRGRTEAKEVLEAFQHWLSYGVRTKPPPKKSLFGESTLQGIADRHIMEAFVEKGKQNTSIVLPDNV